MTLSQQMGKLGRPRRRGGGPRSTAGKRIASRNALRHGFAAAIHRDSSSPNQLERLTGAIAGGDTDPVVRDQAFKIATNEIMLNEIAAHKVCVVERMRERYAVPFAAKDNGLQLGTARLLQGWLAEREINARLPAIVQKYETQIYFDGDEAAYEEFVQRELALGNVKILCSDVRKSIFFKESDGLLPSGLMAMLEEPEKSAEGAAANEPVRCDSDDCDEYEALEAAIQDLLRLDRYEQRAWSRQKRAILELANIKLERRFKHESTYAVA